MTRALIATVILGLLVGCAHTRADELFARGQYLEAAELYADAVRADPSSGRTRRQRDRARQRALVAVFATARGHLDRQQLDQALPPLERALGLSQEWVLAHDAAVAPAAAAAVAQAKGDLRAAVHAPGRAGRALVAEAALAKYRRVAARPEIGLEGELRAEVARAGHEQCARLLAAADAPYWRHLVYRYCTHFGAAGPALPVLPHRRRPPLIQGTLAGLTPGEAARLRRQIHDWFGLTAWHAPQAQTASSGTLKGHTLVLYATRRVTLSRPWTEVQSYSAQESFQEPYQESYATTEYSTVQVPTTSYETYTYSCGTRTCTGTRSVTRYQTQSQSRMVTKYRTAYRTATRTVTRQRHVPRTFTYQADEHKGEYTSALLLRLELGGGLPPLQVRVQRDDLTIAHTHDATHVQAKVAPERAALPAREAWIGSRADELRHALEDALGRHAVQLFCTQPRYNLEEAARCAWWGAPLPPAARAALATVLGDEAERTAALPRP